MLVVCGGVKSILDVPKTLEALETRGVAVAALGTRDFPAFFSLRSPGVDGAPNRAPLRVDSAAEAAAWFGAHRGLGLASGCVPRSNPAPPRRGRRGGHARRARGGARRGRGGRGRDALPPGGPRRRTAGRSPSERGPRPQQRRRRGRRRGRAGAAAARPPARRRRCGAAAVDVCAAGRDGRGRRRRPRRARVAGGVGANVARAAARAAPTAPSRRRTRRRSRAPEADVDVRGCATAAAAPTYVALHGADGDLVGGVRRRRRRRGVYAPPWRARASSSSTRT